MVSERILVKDLFEMSDEDADTIMNGVVDLIRSHKTIPEVAKKITSNHSEASVLAGMVLQKAIDHNNRAAQYTKSCREYVLSAGATMDIGKMLDLSDEDARAVLIAVAAAFTSNLITPDAVGELAEKYGADAILAGVMMNKALDRNDRIDMYGVASEDFIDPAAIFGAALRIDADEARTVCEDVGKIVEGNSDWTRVFAGVGSTFGERAVYAGAFLMHLYSKAVGEPVKKKKYDYGRG